MKFSDVEPSAWNDLSPYVDTCLLPVTGLTGGEQPWEATQALEYLRDALDCLEIPYKGRVLTYPAFHYISGEVGSTMLNQICAMLKDSFRFVVLVTADERAADLIDTAIVDASFVLTPEQLKDSKAASQQNVAEKLQQLWAAR